MPRRGRRRRPRVPCSYCARLLLRPTDRHMLGSTRIECPAVWDPWYRFDLRAATRGDWKIKFLPLPMYVYVVKHKHGRWKLITPFAPFVTTPTHPYIWDAIAATHLTPDALLDAPGYPPSLDHQNGSTPNLGSLTTRSG